MHDPDYYNTIVAEEQGIKKWEQKERNRILAMSDTKRKQKEWSKLFPIMTLDDEYLNSTSNIF